MLERESLGWAMGAFLTGVAVTSGPWLLTILVLALLRATSNVGAGTADVERIITVIYAVVIVTTAPIDIVLSRYAADRVYERRRDRIAPPLRRVLAVCLLAFPALGLGVVLYVEAPLALAVPGVVLAAVVGGQWLLLSAAGGLSSPAIILRAFALGAPMSVLGAIVVPRVTELGAAGQLCGFVAGQLVTLGMLLWGTFRALPDAEDEGARVLPAFREYWLLGAAAFAFHAGIWIDKLIVYILAGGTAASVYAASAAIAWLSVVPACAQLFVTVETAFERRFRAFYAALHEGASLPQLERLAAELKAQVYATLAGTGAVQVGVTLVGLFGARFIAVKMGLGEAGAVTLTWLLVGSAAQLMALAAILLLHYFDFRREAFVAAVTQLVAGGVATLLVGAPSPHLGLGYALACAVTCAVSLFLLRRRMNTLLERTFQEQPYATEDY
jgi:polysaccharide biosynthesis protein PelG